MRLSDVMLALALAVIFCGVCLLSGAAAVAAWRAGEKWVAVLALAFLVVVVLLATSLSLHLVGL